MYNFSKNDAIWLLHHSKDYSVAGEQQHLIEVRAEDFTDRMPSAIAEEFNGFRSYNHNAPKGFPVFYAGALEYCAEMKTAEARTLNRNYVDALPKMNVVGDKSHEYNQNHAVIAEVG